MTMKNEELEIQNKKMESLKRQNSELEVKLRFVNDKMNEHVDDDSSVHDYAHDKITHLTKRLQESELIRASLEEKIAALADNERPEKLTKVLY